MTKYIYKLIIVLRKVLLTIYCIDYILCWPHTGLITLHMILTTCMVYGHTVFIESTTHIEKLDLGQRSEWGYGSGQRVASPAWPTLLCPCPLILLPQHLVHQITFDLWNHILFPKHIRIYTHIFTNHCVLSKPIFCKCMHI